MPSLLGIVAATFVLACGAARTAVPTPPLAAAPRGAAVSAESLVVTIAPESASIHNHQPLRLTITARTTGPGTQTVELTTGCVFDYEVLSSSGEVLGTSEQMCTEVMGRRGVGPGAPLTGVLVWVPGLRGNVSPPPGRYAVRGVLLRAGAPVRSAPVPVELLP